MFEAVVGLEKLTIRQCQALAKDLGFDGATFDLCGPLGRKACTWRDAYLGVFTILDDDKTFIASQFEYVPDVWCENLMPPASPATTSERQP